MEYLRSLTERINDHDKWPDFDRADFLEELNEIADKAMEKRTIEGYLAAMLIYQQLAEEVIKVFLLDHEFFIQLSVYPAKIEFPTNEKIMFGKRIEKLKNTIFLDESKDEIIELANKLNQIRIELVHGITKIPNLADVEKKVVKAKDYFDTLLSTFEMAHDMFALSFKDFRKDWSWNEHEDEDDDEDENDSEE